MCHRRIKIRHKPLACQLWSFLTLNKLMLAIECILNLWNVLDEYFVMYISATAALYSKM